MDGWGGGGLEDKVEVEHRTNAQKKKDITFTILQIKHSQNEINYRRSGKEKEEEEEEKPGAGKLCKALRASDCKKENNNI